MSRYLAMRLLSAVPVILGVVILVFFALRVLPGDPTDKMIADWGMSAEDLERIRAQWGLNEPLHVQFVQYLGDLVRGDFGRSYWSRRPVLEQIAQQLPATLSLTLASLAVSLVISLPLGILAAIRQNTWIDTVCMVISLIGVSMPIYWLGLLLLLFFGVYLQWLPLAGSGSLKHLILPAFTLGFGLAGIVTRLVRSSMLDVLRQDFMRTARAKGMREWGVILRHGLRNAMIPVTTIIGLQIAGLLGGAVLTETVFARPGIGAMAVAAVTSKDYPLMQALIFLIAGIYVFVNLAVDIFYGVLDPRIRYE
jgi:ABC-type dipeptide/oligopeptide/nickel transport system permease component